MRAAAHTKGGYGGVPQSVGKEFVAADKEKKKHALIHVLRHGKKTSGSISSEGSAAG
jgi:hypothetical protein